MKFESNLCRTFFRFHYFRENFLGGKYPAAIEAGNRHSSWRSPSNSQRSDRDLILRKFNQGRVCLSFMFSICFI